MDELEDSTLDLIYRRGVRPLSPVYVVILVTTASLAALPVVRVNRVVNARGIIRPVVEPAEVCSPVAGVIDSTILVNNLCVNPGDTVAWIRQDIPEARLKEFDHLIEINNRCTEDIRRILNGNKPLNTGRYIQSFKHHETALSCLKLQKDYLEEELHVSEMLYREKVIPNREYMHHLSDFLLICARIDDMQEQYRTQLEEELSRIERENREYGGEMVLITASMANYFVIAATGGSVQNCTGLSRGSVVTAGQCLGIVSPYGNLAAVCYLETGYISLVGPGTPVRLTFDGPRTRDIRTVDTGIWQVDNDVLMSEGNPVLRVKCHLEDPSLKKGMTFTASFLLGRESLASMILERLDLSFNPTRSASRDHEI
ncbi:MAG: hypothetical protein EHM46_00555 [Bacteroidetes bacterium]|nr:MAG: hypothetical protein EHM46_00555 [Bacteroidota bacterium]